MVKGITRQVIVVKGPDTRLFEQAIFLVRDDVISEGGITEEALLREARQACKGTGKPVSLLHRLLWFAAGASLMGFIWAIISFI